MRRDERGMAMLEMVIVLPLLLLVLFGIVELGLAFARFQVVSNAAREGARVAALYRENCSAGAVLTDVEAAVARHGTQFGMSAGELETSVVGACSAGTSTVTVTYRHVFFALPDLGTIQTAVDLTGLAAMRNEL